jgi:VanZ family protein
MRPRSGVRISPEPLFFKKMASKSIKQRNFYLIMTLLIALEIFLFSTISTPIGERVGFNLSSLYHLGIFFAFTFFLSLYLRKNKKIDGKTIVIVILISLAYALSDEFHQLFVVGRFASLKDVAVDLVGSSLAILAVKILEWLRKI